MGGAANTPERSSSPMKRRASDLEEDALENLNKNGNGNGKAGMAGIEAVNVNVKEEAAREVVNVTKANVETDTASGVQQHTPSIDEQISIVTGMCQTMNDSPLEENAEVYLVSTKWLARVQIRGSGAKARAEDLIGEVGPVDNSDIILEVLSQSSSDQFVRLKPDLLPSSFQYFPLSAWNYIVNLYGVRHGQSPIIRYACKTNGDTSRLPNIQYELHPPVFRIHRLWSVVSTLPVPQELKAKDPPAPTFVMSRNGLYVDLLKKAKKATGIETSSKVRVWRLTKTLPAGQSTVPSSAEPSPPQSRTSTPAPDAQQTLAKLLLPVNDFLTLQTGVDREIIDIPDHSANPNYNGKSFSVDMAGLGADQDLVLDEHIHKEQFVSNYSPSASDSIPASVPSNSVPITSIRSVVPRKVDSGRNSPSGPITRGRTKSGRTLGAVGLSNLGNTCYMNSALQCVRSVEELTKYFLTDEADEELNVDNPLGNNGHVAMEYSRLLKDMYRDPTPNSVTPRSFKQTIGRYAPSFSGYGQQDSQEFLGFLLDGLQEDLSRIKKKPYIEKPDSTDEMVGDPEAIREMADKVWDITKKRDDSVIADLFTGMYKSTLVCPVCSKVSITFDPFNNLTLQLPLESIWHHTVFYFPLNGPPIRMRVELDKQASVKAMKQFISKRVNVPVEKLFVAETWKQKFYRFYEDLRAASEEISANDEVTVYELESAPTNWPPRKRKIKVSKFVSYNAPTEEDIIPEWDDPMADRMIIPVIHRRPNQERRSYRKAWEIVPVPHFIIVTPDEARNEDIIRRKILEKIACFTTHNLFHPDEDSDESDHSTDADIVITNASDADSSGDGKVSAMSVDGEDDVVDVTMKEAGFRLNNESRQETLPDSQNSTRQPRPRWLDPDVPLIADLQTIFHLKYFNEPRELLPNGWNSVDEDKDYPLLSSRDPRFNEAETPEEDDRNAHSGSVSSEEDGVGQYQVQTSTRMNDESSEDELASTVNVKTLPVRSSNKTVQQQSPDSSSCETEEGPLVRLGEGIIVDWDAQAYTTVFDGEDGDKMRGQPTYVNVPEFVDLELDNKRQARDRQRKKGLTLDECLDEFGKEEILSEQDTWYCPRCKEHRRASKKFELWKTPDILVMHLKRFSSSGMRRDKLDVEVDFPIEGLDLSSRVSAPASGKHEIYDLFAVDDHWGGLGGGHYTAFAKSFVDGEWYEYNDSSVSKQKNTSSLVSKGAYLLFYRRRSDVPLGGERFKQIFENFDKSHYDEESDSGEGRRLDGGSSLLGSSSALTGVGAAHQGGSADVTQGGCSASSVRGPPSYESHLNNDQAVAAPQGLDAVMNDGLDIDLDKEAVDVSTVEPSKNAFRGPLEQSWSFNNITDNGKIAAPSGAASETAVDASASDIVQHDSSADGDDLKERLQDFNDAETEYGDEFEAATEIPDMDEDHQMAHYGLREDVLDANRVRNVGVTARALDDDDGSAAEIYLEENENVLGRE